VTQGEEVESMMGESSAAAIYMAIKFLEKQMKMEEKLMNKELFEQILGANECGSEQKALEMAAVIYKTIANAKVLLQESPMLRQQIKSILAHIY
jgi:hypothetical protein